MDLLGTITICSVRRGEYIEPLDDFSDEVLIEFLLISGITELSFFIMSRACDLFEHSDLINLGALAAFFATWLFAVNYGMIMVFSVIVDTGWSWEWAAPMWFLLGVGCFISAFGDALGWMFMSLVGVFSS